MRKIKFLIISFFTLSVSLLSNELMIDKNKSKELTLDKVTNGVPLINIEKPNSNGLSHNFFKEYNVTKKGVIHNNTLYFEKTKLGGLVYGNPNLQKEQKTAKTILTEVTGVNRTKLEGFIEIAGDKADFILANPNGLYVDGAGFINTGSITLSTGDFNTLKNPEKGNIEVAGEGLDLRNINKSELIARTAKLTAPIYGGKELDIKLGSKTKQNKPEYSLDARALGSIYAGKINILSTEDGVGVKSEALVYAEKDNLVIDSKGRVYLNKAEAKKNINIKSTKTEIANKLLAEDSIDVKNNTIVNNGEILANEGINIDGNLKNNNNIFSNSYLNIDGNVENQKSIKVKDELKIKSLELSNEGSIVSESNISINSEKILNENKLLTQGKLSVINKSLINKGEISSEKEMNIENQEIKNIGEITSKKNIAIKTKGIENNLIKTKAKLKIEANDYIVSKNIYSENDLVIKTKKLNNLDEISSGGNIEINSKKIESNKILSKEDIKINSNFLETKEKIYSDKNINLSSEYIKNEGEVLAGKNIEIINKTLINNKTIQSDENTDIKSENIKNENLIAKNLKVTTNEIENNKKIITTENLDIEAKNLNNKGLIESLENTNLNISKIINKNNIVANKKLDINNKTLENNAKIYSGTGVNIENGLINNTGEILSEKDITIKTKDIDSKKIIAKGKLNIDSETLRNREKIYSEEDAILKTQNIENLEEISSSGEIEIASKNIDSKKIQAEKDIKIKSGTLKSSEEIYSGQAINIKANNIENNGNILAIKDINLDSKKIANDGFIQSNGQMNVEAKEIESKSLIASDLKIKSSKLKNTEKIVAKGNLKIISEELNSEGLINSSENINLKVSKIINKNNIVANKKLDIINETLENNAKIYSETGTNIENELINNTGEILSEKDIVIKTKDIDSKKIIAKGKLNIDSETLRNTEKIYSEEDTILKTQKLENLEEISSSGKIKIDSKNIDSKKIKAKEDIEIKSEILKSSEEIYSGKDINIKSNNIENSGNILAVQNIKLDSPQILNKKKIKAKEDITINTRNIQNKEEILAGKNLNIKSEKIKNLRNIIGGNEVLLNSKTLENDTINGFIYSDNSLEINSDKINLTKNIAAKNRLKLKTKELGRENSYITDSAIDLNIDGNYENNFELIGNNLTLTANNIKNNSILASKGKLKVEANNDVENEKNSLIYSKNNLTLSGKNLKNKGDILSKNDLEINTKENIENLSANITADNNILIKGKNFINKGHLTGNYTKKLVRGHLSNINISKLPKKLIDEVKSDLDNKLGNTGRKKATWHGNDFRLETAEEGISNYISHKSYLKARNNISFIIDNEILNQEADILADKNIDIKANKFINAREGKEIDRALIFERTYSYSARKKSGLWGWSWTTKFRTLSSKTNWKDILYSDKPTQIIAGGNINVDAEKVGNGESKENTNPIISKEEKTFNGKNVNASSINFSLTKPNTQNNISIDRDAKISNTKPINVETNFNINNNSLVKKIKRESAIGLVDYIDIPENNNGIFLINKKNENPKFSYLIETNPKLINKEFYLGSDYFFKRLKFNPDRDIRLLGDSYYENKLITKAVLEGTGKKYLYSNDVNTERKKLFDNGIKAQKDLKLSLGVSLSKEQINNLKSNIIWYVEEEILGEKVLVPKIYLTKETLKEINEEEGNIIKAGGNIAINSLILDNGGKIIAENNVNVKAKSILQNALYSDSGISGENISLFAEKNIENIGGNIEAEKDLIMLSSKGDIKNKKKLAIHENDLRNIFTDVKAEGNIKAKNIKILANNIENLGADIRAEDSLELSAKKDIKIGNLETRKQKVHITKNHFILDEEKNNVASKLEAKDIKLSSLKNIEIKGSDIIANNEIGIKAEGDIELLSGKNSKLHREEHTKKKSFGRSSSSVDISYEERNVASNLIGENVKIESGKDINVVGSDIYSKNDINLGAKENIIIASALEGNSKVRQKTKTGFLKLSGRAKLEDNLKYSNVESNIYSEKNINMNADKDISVVASKLNTEEDINLKAKENVNIISADDKIKHSEKESKYKVGLFASAKNLKFEVGLKTNLSKNKESDLSTKVKESKISSKNNINIESGEDTNIQASTLVSKNTNIKTKGELNLLKKDEKNINNVSGTEIETKLSARLDLSGIKDTVNSVKNTVKGIKDLPKVVKVGANLIKGKDINEALAGNEAGLNEINNIMNGPKKGSVGAGIYASASIEKNKSKVDITNSVGTNLISQENISLSSDEKLKMEKAKILAKNITIDSKKDIEIKSGISSIESEAENKSLSGEINILAPTDFNVGGGISEDKSSEKTHANTKINGENINIKTQEDLIVKGGNIEAEKVNVEAKNLHLESMQDEVNSSHKSLNLNAGYKTVGGGVELGKYEKKWVNEQSTIIGKEKSEINVAEKTKLVGSVLGGADTTLKIKELEFEDIHDKEKGFNVGLSGSVSFNNKDKNGKTKTSKTAEVSYDAVDRKQINRATIGAGTIIVDGKEKNPNINRDETKAQEITKDISVSKIKANYSDEKREWSEVSNIMGEYGEKLGGDLDNLNEHTVKIKQDKKLKEKLGKTFYDTTKKTEEFIDNKLRNKVLGIIPTEDTNGGIVGELKNPKLLIGYGAKPLKIKYTGIKNEKGEIKVVPVVEGLTDKNYEEFIKNNPDSVSYVNGIGNSQKDFVEGFAEGTFTNKEMEILKNGGIIEKVGIFNPTNGMLADVAEAGIGLLGLKTGINLAGKDVEKIFKKYPKLLENFRAHSQGTVKYTAAIKALAKTKEGRELIKENMGENYLLGLAIDPIEYKKLEKTLNEIEAEKVGENNSKKIELKKLINHSDIVPGMWLHKANTDWFTHPVANYNKEHFDEQPDGSFTRKKIGNTEIKLPNFDIKIEKIIDKNSKSYRFKEEK